MLTSETFRPSKMSEFDPALLAAIGYGTTFGNDNFLFYSPGPGLGKTSMAMALIRDMDCPYKYINGSSDNGVDYIREEVLPFCKSASIDGKMKYVIIDEACRLTPSAQDAMKVPIEEYHEHTRFIFICNNSEKIIQPLWSRLKPIRFDRITTQNFYNNRMFKAAIATGVTQLEAVAMVRKAAELFPDYRKGVELVTGGKLEEEITIRPSTALEASFIFKACSPASIEKYIVDSFNTCIEANQVDRALRIQSHLENHRKTAHVVINAMCVFIIMKEQTSG